MNNFIFENETKVFFGRGCVKEYLACLTKGYGDTVILAFGGGSIKKNGIYDEVVSILNRLWSFPVLWLTLRMQKFWKEQNLPENMTRAG